RWHAGLAGVGRGETKTFVGGKKEELVLEDRGAGRSSKLLHLRWINDAGKVILGIGRLRIAAEYIGRAVQRIRTRLDTNVYDRSVPPAIFRWSVLLVIEFLNGIERQHVGRIRATA